MKPVYYVFGLLFAAFLLSGCQTMNVYDIKLLLSWAIIIVIVFLFLVLALHSNLIRDEVNDSDAFKINALKLQQLLRTKTSQNKNPYSLTKVQFGLWTVIISSSYVYLSLCKGDCASLPVNKTALVLMGIYSGMAATTAIMDKNEISDNRPRHQNTPSQGFFVDILSDDNGISLHRFQNLVWTIIAVIVYLYKVAEIKAGCILPELSDTLLALTGLSSATYLVLRSKENDPPVQDASDPTATPSQIDSTATTPAAPAGTLVNAN